MSEDFLDIEAGEEADAPTVEITDEAGRSLLCYVEKSVEVDGTEYLLLMPVDAPIEIFGWEEDEDDEESLVDLDDEEIGKIFEDAQAVLAERDLVLHRTGFTLTASGELPDPSEEDVLTLDVGDDEDNLMSEQFQMLCDFFHEEQGYTICTPFEPLLFFGRLTHAKKAELLTPEEFEKVRSHLEDELFDDLDE